MASTYSNLKFELIGTGELAGTWGSTTNTNIGTAIEQAIVGMATLDSGDFTANVATLALTNTSALQDARALCLNIAAGAVSAAGTVNVPAIQKPYIIINGSSYTVTVKVSGQTGVAVPAGKRTVVYNNGTDVGSQIDWLAALDLTSVTVSGGTANGVAYLNGSKVLTTGSALTFDGTSLGTTNIKSPGVLALASNASGNALEFLHGTSVVGRFSGNANGIFTVGTEGSVSGLGTSYATLGAYGPNGGGLRIYRGTGAGTPTAIFYADNTGTFIGSTENTPLVFSQNNNEGMRLTPTGLVIGGTSTSQRFSVFGNANFIGTGVTAVTSPTVYFSNTTASTGRVYGLNSTDGGSFQIFDVSAGNATRVTLDSSGNLGLGVTPSAWDAGFKVIQLGGGAYLGQYNANAVQVGLNTYFNGTSYIYTTTNEASRFVQTDGQFQWFTAPSGTAGNAISFTQAMTLDASGNLLVGATSGSNKLTVNGNGIFLANGEARFADAGNNSISYIKNSGAANTSQMEFWTGATPAERARIDSSGNLLVGITSAFGKISIGQNSQFSYGQGLSFYFSGSSYWNIVNGGSDRLFFGFNGSDRAYIDPATGAFVPVSDQRLKKNIADIGYGLSSVLALRPVSYNMNSQEDEEQKTLGFIAQEALEVVPEAVFEMMNGMYGMDKTAIIPVLIKAIQEQQAIIESLKARLDAANL